MDVQTLQRPIHAPPTGRKLGVTVYVADQNPHRDRSLGITHMTRELIDHMAPRDDLDVSVVTSLSSYVPDARVDKTRQIPLRTDRALGRLITDAFHPWMARTNGDVWYYPKGYAPRIARQKQPIVGTMHDVIVQHYADQYPESRSHRNFKYWISSTQRSLECFDCVLTISKNAADQLNQFCLRYNITPPTIRVTYEGSRWEALRGMHHEKKDQVVHLASNQSHKRTRTLIDFWNTLTQRGRDLPELLLIGNIDTKLKSVAKSTRRISVLPRLGQQELQETVGASRALIMASEIEGFGLPALEAYYAATPVCYVLDTAVDEVLNINTCSSKRIAGGFQLESVDSFQLALDQVLQMSEKDVLSHQTRLYDAFSVKRIASRVIDALRQTAGR